jgi:hypothetical protein
VIKKDEMGACHLERQSGFAARGRVTGQVIVSAQVTERQGAKGVFIGQQSNTGSEITRLREQIVQEHQAACWALDGLASGRLQHCLINRRMQRIDEHRERLTTLVGEQMSLQMVNQVFESSPPQRTEG